MAVITVSFVSIFFGLSLDGIEIVMLVLVSKFSCDRSFFVCHYFIVQLSSVASALEPDKWQWQNIWNIHMSLVVL